MKTLTKNILLPFTNENYEKRFLSVIIDENNNKIKKNIKSNISSTILPTWLTYKIIDEIIDKNSIGDLKKN
jgi:hypothetical protein